MALLFLFRFVVPHVHNSPAGHTRCKQNQGSMGVNGERLCEFLKILTLSVFPAHADADLHQHALTAPPGSSMHRCIRDSSHNTSLKINYTRRGGIVEDVLTGGIQSEYRVC